MSVPPPLRALDAALRAALRSDTRFSHVVAYGSVPQGQGDAFSDLEYWAFLAPGAAVLADAWLRAHLSARLVLVNEFGAGTALLPGLRRVELHVAPASRLPDLELWTPQPVVLDAMRVKDPDGQVARHLAALAARSADPGGEAPALLARTLNWLAFGLNVLARGERVRAHELLWWVQGGALRLARLHCGATGQWGNASRRAETELPTALLARYAALTAGVEGLEDAYASAVAWTLDLAASLHLPVNDALAEELRRATMNA